jgi:hypothetical protein
LRWAASAMYFQGYDVLSWLRLKEVDPATHWLESLKSWSKISLSSFKPYLLRFCHGDQKYN